MRDAPFFVKFIPAPDDCAVPKKQLLLLLFPDVFGACIEPIAKLRSGAVSNRANVGENELLSPAAAFAVIPDVTVDVPLCRELWKIDLFVVRAGDIIPLISSLP